MLPNDRAQPAAPDKPSWGARLWRAHRRAPTWLKVVVVAAAVLFFPVTLGLILLAALVYGIVAVAQGRRTVGASASVAVWGLAVFSAAYKGNRTWLYSVLLLPFVVALAAHAKPLARWFVPCRTVAWVLAWSVPAGVIALKARRTSRSSARSPRGCWPRPCSAGGWPRASRTPACTAAGPREPREPRPRARGPGRPDRPRVPRPPGRPRPGSPLDHQGPAIQGPATGVQRPGAGRGAALRRARRPRPPGRRPPGRGRRSRSRTRWPNSTR